MPRLRPRAYSASITARRTASNTPAASTALGRLLASATSAIPVTTKASAVLNDIGFSLPKRKIAVVRANQATIAVRPTAAHSRPPAVVIASGTHSPRDGMPAAAGGAAGGGPAGVPAGGGRTLSAPWSSMALHPRAKPGTRKSQRYHE